jgi:hypothetical protein
MGAGDGKEGINLSSQDDYGLAELMDETACVDWLVGDPGALVDTR